MHSTLEETLAAIVAEDARKIDLVADSRSISFEAESTSTILVDLPDGQGGAFDLNAHALGQVANDVGIPKRYFDRMRADAPDLFRENVHHWLRNEPERRLIRGLRPTEGESDPVGRAWLSDRYRRLDNIEIARTLLPEFESLDTEVVFHNAAVTEQRLYLRATFPAMEAEVKVGEPIRWGVELRNSEVGAGAFAINAFVLTLVCTNGMVASRELSARHVGRRLDEEGIFAAETLAADDSAFWLAARDTLRAAISEARFEEVVARLRETTTGEKVARPIAASEMLAQRFSLSEEEREAVLLAFASSGDMSQWGMLSAVTNAAQGRESFDRRVEMEEIGWSIATLPGREWSALAAA
jgi:hypothetical protein